jgi:6-phosphogluconate dehydrogenase
MSKADIGLIGLAVMGANLARNIASRGFNTVVFNRTTEKMTNYIQDFGNDHLFGKETLEEFVESIEAPRKIIIMVKAGAPVDAVINQLIPLLDEGDMIIDCGNSNYRDTIRRSEELNEKGLRFVGCGVSGGEEGALKGPSLMPGGSPESWEYLKPIWEAIAAKDFDGGPCVTHIGEGGAGHYVKMVHNGIEYGIMQMIAEAYDLLKKMYGMSPEEIADVFAEYNKGRLESFLFEIAEPVLRRKDEETGEYLIDIILDKAGQKGTGKWTAIDALDRGVGLSSISEAVFARVNSSFKVQRQVLAPSFPKAELSPSLEKEEFIRFLEEALYAGMLSAYAQGLELIKLAAEEKEWQVNLSEISRIWEGGCIIRAKILKFLTDTYKASGKGNPHLFELPEIQKAINEALPAWRKVVSESVQNAIPTPCLTSALQYVDAATTERLPANMIQGLRDYFGAHTYERIDKEGSFHTEWLV